MKSENFSKSCTTVMMCDSAAGVLLPPCVLYRAEKAPLAAWKENGPVGKPCCESDCCKGGTYYTSTKSGWFDMSTFELWFVDVFLPHAFTLTGKIVLTADNLASHFSPKVIELCKQHNIAFICFVPNSTYLSQPLDVTFFRPMKIAWRKVLGDYKLKNPSLKGIPKAQFPRLLKLALDAMDTISIKRGAEVVVLVNRISHNLKSGFRVAGIVPMDRQHILKRLPDHLMNDDSRNISSNSSDNSRLTESVIEFLSNKKFPQAETAANNTGTSATPVRANPARTGRRNKHNVIPGRCVTLTIPVGNDAALVDSDIGDPVAASTPGCSRPDTSVVENDAAIVDSNIGDPVVDSTPGCSRPDTSVPVGVPVPPRKRGRPCKLVTDKSFSGGKEARSDSKDDVECLYCLESWRSTRVKEKWVQCISCRKWYHKACGNDYAFCDFCE